MPHDAAGRYETIQWVMFQMGGVGPMFGQVGFFYKFGGKDYEDKRPRDRYVDQRNVCSPSSTAAWQIAPGCWARITPSPISPFFPWVRNLVGFYGAGELVGIENFPHVTRALATFVARPAVVRGLAIPARPKTS